MCIINMDDRRLQPGPVKQLGFGRPVGLHRAVVVQMVLGEIGEDGGVHLCRIKAVLSQADGRGFYSARFISFIHQAA